MKYCVFSGWYCDDKPRNYATFGTHKIREKDFFNLWYKSVTTFTKPEKIFITDSASPVKPDLPDDPRIEFVSLYKNFGHSAVPGPHYCGFTKALFSGIFYADLNEFDYAVFVEQDCLLYGKNFVENIINVFRGQDLILCHGRGTAQPIQQSFFIMRKNIYRDYINYYMRFEKSDHQFSPEKKMYVISQFFKTAISNLEFGRARPLNFDLDYFYFQHGSDDEITQYNKKLAAFN